MMLMSHLQDTISQTDISTQILFNRALVQIGFCAFRCGLFREAHYTLQEISSCGKTRELLAQGLSGAKDKTPEQEKSERQRLLAFHMHINLELLESIHLVTAMLLEIPNMAHNSDRRKIISKSFRRMLDYSDRQIFSGPSENARDYIMSASRSMLAGEWISCNDAIMSIKVWDYLPDPAEIKAKLTL